MRPLIDGFKCLAPAALLSSLLSYTAAAPAAGLDRKDSSYNT